MGSIERNLKRQSDGDGSWIYGRRSRMDGAASGARYSSKRAGTRLLAGYQASQHGRYERNTSDIPGPSTPLPYYLRRPHTHPNPPRRRGRPKTRTKGVSTTRWTYQAIRACRGRSSDSNRSDTTETVQERFQAAKREDEAAGVDRGRACALKTAQHIVDGRGFLSLGWVE